MATTVGSGSVIAEKLSAIHRADIAGIFSRLQVQCRVHLLAFGLEKPVKLLLMRSDRVGLLRGELILTVGPGACHGVLVVDVSGGFGDSVHPLLVLGSAVERADHRQRIFGMDHTSGCEYRLLIRSDKPIVRSCQLSIKLLESGSLDVFYIACTRIDNRFGTPHPV